MAVADAELLDLLATTRKDFGTSYEVAWKYQRYEYCERLQNKNYMIDGGSSIQRNVVLDETGTARFIQLYEVEDPTVSDVHTEMNVPWTQFRSHYAYDAEEIRRQRGSTHGYISLFQTRQVDCYHGIANMIEEAGFNGRSSVTDTRHPLGIPEALPLSEAGVVTAGYQCKTIRYTGGTTGTVFQNIDADTEDKWQNYGFVYTTIDNAFLQMLTEACLATNFQPPSFVPRPGDDTQGPRRMYAKRATVAKLIRLGNAQDDSNQPKDLAGRLTVNPFGAVMFNSMPIIYVPVLDGKTYDPIYAVDWNKLQMIVSASSWMQESDPMISAVQPSVAVLYVDGQYQQLCLNRRTVGFVGHTVTA